MCARKVNVSGPTMKAAAIDRFGPPSVLKLHTLPVPEPGPNEVLIALQAAGVGVWDADIRGLVAKRTAKVAKQATKVK